MQTEAIQQLTQRHRRLLRTYLHVSQHFFSTEFYYSLEKKIGAYLNSVFMLFLLTSLFMISDSSTCLMALASEGKSRKSLSSESSAPLLVLQKRDLFALGRTVSLSAKMSDE